MRAKSAKAERVAKGVGAGVGTGRSGKDSARKDSRRANRVSERQVVAVDPPMSRSDAGGLKASGVKAWGLPVGGLINGKDRGQAPPPLPVPIASFTI